MNVIPGDVIVEPASNRQAPKAQSIEQLASPGPELDEAAVRATLNAAEANNIDPQTITLDDFAKGPVNTPPEAPKPTVEVPQKFLKPDGVVDVDKIQASTKQLDEAIQKKEEALTKTVEDYMREYTERETKFRNMPNPNRFAPAAPPPPPAQAQPTAQPDPNQNFEEIVRRDWQADPLMTTTRLIDLALQQRLQPFEQKEKSEQVRNNLQALAQKDPRVLREDVYSAIQAKLQNDPDLWKLKNPHKAAWLEVKEELRLGEVPQGTSAQPSRPLSPVLGGGTPPSAPSSAAPTPQSIVANLDALDLRDKKQEALGDEAVRRALLGLRG